MKDFTSRLVLPLGIDVATLVAICTLYSINIILTVVIGIIFLFTLLFRFSRYKLILVAFATLFGTGGEMLCCAPGIELWIYKNPSFWGIPSWLPMIWPILMMTFTEMAAYMHELFSATVTEEGYRLILKLAMALVLVYSVYTFFRIQWFIATVFFIFLVLMIIFAHKPFHIVLFWMAALGGSLGEYICIQNEVWYYTRPFFSEIGIPLSLPLAWGLSANIIFILSRACLGQHHDPAPGYEAANNGVMS